MLAAERNDLSAEWLITEAFMVLLSTVPFDKITVRAIVKKAGISRSTFYVHYQDKFDLLSRMTDQITNELLDLYGTETSEEAIFNSNNIFDEQRALSNTVAIFDHLRKYEHFYRERYLHPEFVFQLSERLISKLKWAYLDETHASFAAYGTVGYIGRWLTSGLKESSSEIAKKLTSVAELSLPQVRLKMQNELSISG